MAGAVQAQQGRPIRRTEGGSRTVVLKLPPRPSGSDVRLVSEAARRYGDFLGLDLAVAGA